MIFCLHKRRDIPLLFYQLFAYLQKYSKCSIILNEILIVVGFPSSSYISKLMKKMFLFYILKFQVSFLASQRFKKFDSIASIQDYEHHKHRGWAASVSSKTKFIQTSIIKIMFFVILHTTQEWEHSDYCGGNCSSAAFLNIMLLFCTSST